jgi:AraC-like DNA-binding protein
MKADTIASTAKNYTMYASTSGYLATAFRHLGLLPTSRYYLDRAEFANNHQDDRQAKTLTKINILHERAFHAVENEDFNKAKEYLLQAAPDIVINGKEDSKALLIKATNDQLMGACEIKLGNFAAADSFLNSSLAKIESVESNLKPYIYRSLADVAIAQKDLEKAGYYLNLIDPYLKSAKVEELMMLTYRSWSQYYELEGNREQSEKFQMRSDEILTKREKEQKKLTSELIENLRLTKEVYHRYSLFLLWGGAALVVLMSIGIFYFFRKQQLYHIRYLTLIEMYEKNPENQITGIETEGKLGGRNLILESTKSKSKNRTRDIKISKKTEIRLHDEFLKFESKHFYLEKSISLNKIASELATNTSYVAYIIQKYRGKDFYDYVQTKRVEYIIDEIQKSPDLVKYKLSYLADKSGFTSLSTFSTAFKQVAGMPPSAFIHFFKMERKKEESSV